jgi:nucleotide-binding universal stress UspA family protein
VRTIVVGIDGSPRSRRALRWALEASVAGGDRVRVVHAWHVPYLALSPLSGAELRLEELEERTRAEVRAIVAEETPAVAGHGPVEVAVVCDGPALALIAAGEQADLLVVGSRGMGGFAGLLLGSTSQQVVAHAPCPVVVVPEDWGPEPPGPGAVDV